MSIFQFCPKVIKSETHLCSNPLFKKLTPLELADVMSALRGPDIGDYYHRMIKSILVARLRTIVFVNHLGIVAQSPLGAGDIKDVVWVLKGIRSAYDGNEVALDGTRHFHDHLSKAIWATKYEAVWGDPEYAQFLSDILRDFTILTTDIIEWRREGFLKYLQLGQNSHSS